ncbi:hypothetical protein ACJIZ3_009308 [Penstemon smallii]|uniref:Uncharacterized protein n=1 Tax=Penstemon smallii TaxID=265156 RepID=A0ABD3TC48_9LAMI
MDSFKRVFLVTILLIVLGLPLRARADLEPRRSMKEVAIRAKCRLAIDCPCPPNCKNKGCTNGRCICESNNSKDVVESNFCFKELDCNCPLGYHFKLCTLGDCSCTSCD